MEKREREAKRGTMGFFVRSPSVLIPITTSLESVFFFRGDVKRRTRVTFGS